MNQPIPIRIIGIASLFLAAWVASADEVRWARKSSTTGDLPAPNEGNQQTCLVIADFDKDGIADFAIGERTMAPSVVWYKWNGKGWERRVIDDTALKPEAGGDACDIDGDGDLDLVLGQDASGNQMWWWENPYPDFSKPWQRHIIKNTGGCKHHVQTIADFNGDGKPELVSWNQKAKQLLWFEIPADLHAAESWPITEVLDTSTVNTAIKQEGMAAFEVNGDGKTGLLAGIYWFKHESGNTFRPTQIADHPGRIVAGHFRGGKVAQIVLAPGDGDGPLQFIECKGDPGNPKSWTRRDLLGKDIIHGHSLASPDINGDGQLDILCGEMAKWAGKPEPDNPDAKAWVLYGDGQGDFKVTVLAMGFGFHEARVADVNGDSRPDVISKPYSWDTPRLDIWLNLGNPSCAPGLGGKFRQPNAPR